MKQHRTGGRSALLFVLLALGLFALLGASQCSRVADDVTGPTDSLVGGRSSGSCIGDCNREHKRLQKDESKLFSRNIKRCRSDDDDDRGDLSGEVECLQAEAQRHLDEIQAIAESHLECIAACGGFDDFEDCMEFCEREERRQKKDEDYVHRKIRKACRAGGDDDDDGDDDDTAHPGGSDQGAPGTRGGSNPCTEAEDVRHEAALAQIDQWVAECASRCHDQGGGSGGE